MRSISTMRGDSGDTSLAGGVRVSKGSLRVDTTARSEFSYGSFLRTVTLPAEADEENITAGYERGILTVRVPLSENPAGARQIEIQNNENGSTAIESGEHSE